MTEPIRILDEFPFTFYGDVFTVGLATDRKLYVPLRLVCRTLGIDYGAQRRRVLRDEAIADTLVVLRFQNYPHGEGETRPREVSCLRLDRLPYWLGTIDARRVKDKERGRAVVRFQREFADVAWAAFRTEILPEDVLAELDVDLPPERGAYHRMMDEASEVRRGLVEHEERIDHIEERITGLEARLEGTDFINSEQGRRYQVMVSLIAGVLREKGRGGAHALVHGEVKKAFKVPSYLLIPEARYPEVVRFLASWYGRITPPGTPLPDVFNLPDQKRLL